MESMLFGFLSVCIVFGLLILAEKLRKQKHLKAEVTRKFIHITVGSFVAFWPFFMPAWVIYAICAAFVLVVGLSRFTKLLPSIHNVDRQTWGDIFFPIGIALVFFLSNDKWIFAASMLHLGLADGIAALVGEKYGATNAYKILGYKKTVAGNIAFFAISVGILSWLVWATPSGFSHLGLATIVWLAPIATAAESLAIRGTDNVVVPVVLTVLLNAMQSVG